MNQKTDDRRAAILCSHVAEGAFPILRAVRDEPEMDEDSGWQFLCCQFEEEDPDSAKVWLICEVLENDPTLLDYIDLPPGTVLTRQNKQEPWSITRGGENDTGQS